MRNHICTVEGRAQWLMGKIIIDDDHTMSIIQRLFVLTVNNYICFYLYWINYLCLSNFQYTRAIIGLTIQSAN